MDKYNTYLKEKQQALSHLWFVSLVSLMGISLIVVSGDAQQHQLFFLKVILFVWSLFSFWHYRYILKFPYRQVTIRRAIPIFMDILVLTISIVILDSLGLFLLPLYVLVVMESGIHYGFAYFYFSLISSSVSWLVLLYSSTYWQAQSDTVAIFAITTFLIPLIYMKQMMTMHQKHEKLHEKLVTSKEDAHIDTLTALPNRKKYNEYMQKLLQEDAFFALFFIDLNKFKVVNDTYGHHVGDEVLIEVARRLSQCIGEEEMLARLGGDEFVIITKRKKVFLAKFLERLEKNTIGYYQASDANVYIELSIGISLFPDDSTSETFLRKYADEAMYSAKKRADTYHIFYEDLKASESSC